jgi:hypothetical protein
VLRSIFGPKRNEIIGGWRKLYNEKPHNLFFAKYNDQFKDDEMDRTARIYI